MVAAFAALAVGGAGALGCTTSPERLCDHFVALAEGESGQLPSTVRQDAVRRCVVEKSALQRAEPKKYACFAECLTEKRHLVDAAECEPTCGIPPKPPPPDEPPTEGVPGLWVDPYADAAPTLDAAAPSAVVDAPSEASADARRDAR